MPMEIIDWTLSFLVGNMFYQYLYWSAWNTQGRMGKPVKTLKILDHVFNWLKTKSHHVIFLKKKQSLFFQRFIWFKARKDH